MIIKTPSWNEDGWIYLTDIENPHINPLLFSRQEYKYPCPTHPVRMNPDHLLLREVGDVSKYDPDKLGHTHMNVNPRIIETWMEMLDKDHSSPTPHCWVVYFMRKGKEESLITSENVYLMSDKGDTVDKHLILGRENLEGKNANMRALTGH